MIIFDQLRISDDGDRMYINIHVNKASYFNDVYIDAITIMTADKVSETSPEAPTSDYIYKKKIEGEQREVDLVLTAQDFARTWATTPEAMKFRKGDLSNNLFFVYVTCKLKSGGTLDASCVPCRLDEETTVGVTFDENMLHQRVMSYTKDLQNDCSIHTDFIDFILQWNAFKASIETEHYVAAIKFFNMLFSAKGDREIIKGCGCHG